MTLLADTQSADPAPRRGHAVLDLPSRNLKAEKIARLLGPLRPKGRVRMLEVGVGSGGIAAYFANELGLDWDVDGVDVEDVRLVKEGFRFTRVTSAELPFDDGIFDVVLSNHVIEHVGEDDEQLLHLSELMRVLRPGGAGYLAVPCRWMVIEPHFKLPLLSWLPQCAADVYVRAAGKGTHYDCRPLTVGRLEAMLAATGFEFEQEHGDALRITYELERPDAFIYRWLLKPMPDFMYRTFRRAFPTLIYVLRKPL